MRSWRKYFKAKGNSLLESVFALAIISICMGIALQVCTIILKQPAIPARPASHNLLYESFYLHEIGQDSLTERYSNEQWILEKKTEGNLYNITVTYKDSTGGMAKQHFYLAKND